ncbi:MAG: hypothetical protein CMF70_12385 [Magnetovibrio sp.]|nr:hypothetical protein [Magnetovibrio sp.]
MTKELKVLIRISKWQIDQTFRKLRLLEEEVEALREELVELVDQQDREKQITAEKPTEGGLTFGNYTEAVIGRKRAISKEIEDRALRIEEVREELRLIYLEAKKYEIAQENRDSEEKRRIEHLEQTRLDEVGILSYIKKQ